jgi:hypothetical protein
MHTQTAPKYTPLKASVINAAKAFLSDTIKTLNDVFEITEISGGMMVPNAPKLQGDQVLIGLNFDDSKPSELEVMMIESQLMERFATHGVTTTVRSKSPVRMVKNPSAWICFIIAEPMVSVN